MGIQIISNIIQNLAVITASIIAIHGINSWRRETKWKKKYELVEDTLVLFYETDEKLKIIRSPAGYVGEGRSRKRREDETPEESDRLDNAYVIYERWEKEKEPFLKLQTIKFRFIAVFGKEFIAPFEEVTRIMNEIFLANNRLRDRYWKDQGRKNFTNEELKKHVEKMQQEEAKIWDSWDDTDVIRIRMKQAIEQIEVLYNKILGRKYHNK